MKSFKTIWVALILGVGLVLYEQHSTMACRKTIIYIQNGTSLNVSRWYRNGFFGNLQHLPIPGTVKPSFNLGDSSSNRSFSTVNPIVPKLPFFINPKQDCVCGLTKISEDFMKVAKEDRQKAEKSKSSKEKILATEFIVDDENEPDSSFIMRARLAQMVESGKTNLDHIRPWMAKVSIEKHWLSKTYECSGVLLNGRYVLTAAHCVCHGILLDCSHEAQFPNTTWYWQEPSARMGNNPIVKVRLGTVVDQKEASIGTYFGRRVGVNQNYDGSQKNSTVGDVAVIELKTTVGVPRDSGMTPICLPPLDSDEINEYDCFKPSKERNFPNMIFDGTDKICHPNSDSRLTTFEKSKYIPKENERVTNGFGPANARSPCKSNCKMEEPPQKKICDQVFNDTNLQKDHPDVMKFTITISGEKTVCHPMMKYNKTGRMDYGYCNTSNSWGYCLSEFVAKNDSETRLPGGGIELKLKTFGEDLGCSTTNEEHICTGSVSELNDADVKVIKEKDGKYKLEGEVKKTPSEKEGEENFCYGDEGSPLWKFHNSVNGFDKEVQLAVLTGILTRHHNYCTSIKDPSVLIHTRIMQSNLLSWILFEIKDGMCHDQKAFLNYYNRNPPRE